jgi:hypothetical protein
MNMAWADRVDQVRLPFVRPSGTVCVMKVLIKEALSIAMMKNFGHPK